MSKLWLKHETCSCVRFILSFKAWNVKCLARIIYQNKIKTICFCCKNKFFAIAAKTKCYFIETSCFIHIWCHSYLVLSDNLLEQIQIKNKLRHILWTKSFNLLQNIQFFLNCYWNIFFEVNLTIHIAFNYLIWNIGNILINVKIKIGFCLLWKNRQIVTYFIPYCENFNTSTIACMFYRSEI